jgi:threonyl-tRNA synthetase
MLTLRLPDGTKREVPSGTRPRQVAEAIGKRLAQAAVAAKVDGNIIDIDREFPVDDVEVSFQVLTEKDREALDVLRHSCAHVMARAVMRLFPGTQLAFGPTIENGFYYDIDVSPPIREEDFPRIEAEMARIVEDAEPFERFDRPIPEAVELCKGIEQGYKVEHIEGELKRFPSVSFYRQGEFIDLCRGPHIPDAGRIGAFKVLSIAGAYWKNDASRKQLQRLYGTAFFNQKDLDAYLHHVEEAKKRDHRVLGKQLRLFTISPTVGSGLILWMPKGATVRVLLESFIRDELLKRGYQPVYTPHIGKLELYRTSGHFPYYRESQFPPLWGHPDGSTVDHHIQDLKRWAAHGKGQGEEHAEDKAAQWLAHRGIPRDRYEAAGAGMSPEEGWQAKAAFLEVWLCKHESYLLKPMNCPHHIQIYKAEPHSYRDLPVRLAEFGTVYRFEQTGELSGMTRVRGFTQDDAHLFVMPEQIESEMRGNIELVFFVLKSLGLSDYRVRIGLRDRSSDKYVGTDEDWNSAEAILVEIVKSLGLPYTAESGEAAFYGPKIDFVVRDCIGREWQLGTVQLDYNLPKRFELEYIGPDNKPHRPVMIHRAPFGSMERFVGILIEHFAGAFPLWLAPEQARILPVTDKVFDYARGVEARFREKGFRISGDYRHDKIGSKIRDAQLEKIPYMLVVGEKEVTAGTVAVRDRVDGDLGAKPVDEVLESLVREVEGKVIRQVNTASAGLGDTGAKFGE